MQKTITKSIILTLIFVVALSVSYVFASWTGPTQAPPAGNTPTPVHVGTTAQIKDGPLALTRLLVSAGPGTNGESYLMGPVGLGTITPQGDRLLAIDGGVINETYSTNLHSVGGGFLMEDQTKEYYGRQRGGPGGLLTIIPKNGVALELNAVGDNNVDFRFGSTGSDNNFWNFSKRSSGENDSLVLSRYNAGVAVNVQNWLTNGNVGIGTAIPTQKLDVAGNIVASGTICDKNGCIGSGAGGGGGHGDGANCPAGQVAAGVDANGNVQGCIVPTGTLSCTSVNKTGVVGSTVIASCPASYSVTGGGCANGSGSQPSGNGWSCSGQDGVSKTAFAQCCRIE